MATLLVIARPWYILLGLIATRLPEMIVVIVLLTNWPVGIQGVPAWMVNKLRYTTMVIAIMVIIWYLRSGMGSWLWITRKANSTIWMRHLIWFTRRILRARILI